MPGWVGADVDQLRAVVTQTSGRLDAVCWTGADGDRFRSQWRGEAAGRLRSAAEALDRAAQVLLRNADEQEQASSAGGGVNGSGLGPGPPRPAWGWPGDVGATPWFLRPGGGFDPGGMSPLPGGGDGAAPTWSFPNPFDEYRDVVGSTPIWPISVGTAIGMTPLGDAMNVADGTALVFDDRLGVSDKLAEGAHLAADIGGGGLRQAGFNSRNPALYLGGAAVSQWGDVVSEFNKADFSQATVARNIDFLTAHPGQAFEAARDAVVDYIPKLISNFTINPFGK